MPPSAESADAAGASGRSRWLPDLLLALAAGVALAAALAVAAPPLVSLHLGQPLTDLVPAVVSGVHGAEENYGHRIRWTSGTVRLTWPRPFGVEPSAIVVRLAGFPGRQPDQLELRINAQATRHAVPAGYDDIRVPLSPGVRWPLDVTLTTLTTRPPGDPRDLGIRLESVTLENRAIVDRLRAAAGREGLVVVAFGALAWLAGAWVTAGAASVRRWSASLATCVLAGLVIWWLGPTVLGEPAVAVGPLALGVLVTWSLARVRQPRAISAFAGLLVTAQALVLVTWCVASFVDAPRWDIWDIVPLLVRQESQGLTIADLWGPHNEHRPMVARVVLLANVAWSRWNHWNELWLILLITAAHVWLYARFVRSRDRGASVLLAVAGAGAFIASATQWENFLQGWQVALILGALGVSWAFMLLTTGTPGWGHTAAAAALVLVGTAGFGSCLIGWPLGAVGIALRGGPRWKARAVAWAAVGVLVSVAYLHGLPRPGGGATSLLHSAGGLFRLAHGTFMALAIPVWYAPMHFTDPTALTHWLLPAIGAIGLALGVLVVAGELRRPDVRQAQAWLFPTLLMVFAVAACALTALGRVPMGMHMMTAARYVAFTGLYWVGLVLLLTVCGAPREGRSRQGRLALAAVIVAFGLHAWVQARPLYEDHYVSGTLSRDALLREDWPNTLALFPVPPVLDERRQYLQRKGLSLYRPGAR